MAAEFDVNLDVVVRREQPLTLRRSARQPPRQSITPVFAWRSASRCRIAQATSKLGCDNGKLVGSTSCDGIAFNGTDRWRDAVAGFNGFVGGRPAQRQDWNPTRMKAAGHLAKCEIMHKQ